MTNQDLIIQAIHDRKPVSFEYLKEDKIQGVRVGNPHAIYQHNTTDNIIVDIFQTDGVSDTESEKPLPNWRNFNVEDIHGLKILSDLPQFKLADGYVSDSERYNKVIAKV